jgi:hypothetical protein
LLLPYLETIFQPAGSSLAAADAALAAPAESPARTRARTARVRDSSGGSEERSESVGGDDEERTTDRNSSHESWKRSRAREVCGNANIFSATSASCQRGLVERQSYERPHKKNRRSLCEQPEWIRTACPPPPRAARARAKRLRAFFTSYIQGLGRFRGQAEAFGCSYVAK